MRIPAETCILALCFATTTAASPAPHQDHKEVSLNATASSANHTGAYGHQIGGNHTVECKDKTHGNQTAKYGQKTGEKDALAQTATGHNGTEVKAASGGGKFKVKGGGGGGTSAGNKLDANFVAIGMAAGAGVVGMMY